MPRRRTLLWTISVSAAAVVAAIAVIHISSDTTPNAVSMSAPPTSASSRPPTSEPAPVVAAKTSRAFSYLSDLKPSGDLAELVNHGPVKIAGSIYPKSISFYCNVGDQTAFPTYTVKRHARRFEATIGLAPNSPPQFEAGLLLVGDGRTLRTVTVTVPKPKTVDLDVRGLHRLRLECFGSGNSATGGEAVSVAWGNARFSARR